MNATKTQDRHNIKVRLRLFTLLIFSMAFSLFTRAQVTVGTSEVPQEFSILEIESNRTGGLRLPHLTTVQRDALKQSAAFQSEIVGKGKGLTIYNTTTDCVEYWNSTDWVSLCDGGPGPDTENPGTTPVGSGYFSGKTCFDVVETNEGGGCGTIVSRQSQKANFAQTATNTQPYTFKTDGTVSKIRFYAVDASGLVIESITPGSSNWETATNLSGTFTLTVKYKSDLNTTAKGKDRDNALVAILYVVYNDNAAGTGTDRHLELKVSVQDCTCCPGYLAVGGEYVKNDPTTVLYTGQSNIFWSQLSQHFTATGRDLCFYKTDSMSGVGGSTTPVSWNTAMVGCEIGTQTSNRTDYLPHFIDEEHRSMGGWRLPNLAELAAISDVAPSLSTQPNSASGTQNMYNSYYHYLSNTLQDTSISIWHWAYSTNSGFSSVTSGWGVNSIARCVRTF